MSSNEVGLCDVLGSVVWSLQNEIAPMVTDEYAASICKTAGALLRSCIVRVAQEGQFLVEDNRHLRAVVAQAADALNDPGIGAAPPQAAAWPERHMAYVDLAALTAEAGHLSAALSVAMMKLRAAERTPKVAAAHSAVDDYLSGHLAKQAAWLLDPFIGEIR
jgi:hypothetical protein